ncbi:prolyl aminopeptidase [Neptunomonas phycophila]|jgi:proline iminopeptidase|uniref:Proline iminopeptidase n=1 Tax=Neptunomonas phycophila TaxID=1572645 RepID=A0AAW7XM44_9GAMM|nr:prolyl aminopeptidase [Neptunomonas phycophila]MDO6455316.1 prolyl aminopeptidase [Neptunomonas phycophila]QLE96287.1 prolyl aminopeptidase [Neptunomonas phycophila]
MRILYPDIHPYKEQMLDVGDGHSIYIEESGNAEGLPVLFVHGGPGGGTSNAQRSFFNPEKYRIILFDQRGCGRSQPHASLEHNTTAHLIADIEKIRSHLNIEQWMLFGGSWGSTLSLLYAQAFPDRVNGLILRGIFLSRQQDIHWLYQHGASVIFPDYWQDFIHKIPVTEHNNLLHAYYQRLTSDNELERMSAAKAWSIWEGRCSTLVPNADTVEHFSDPHIALSMARIEAHYFVNSSFIEENQILDNAACIAHIPTILVHGRYDMVCPVQQAYELHRQLPQAELHIVREAGHSAYEKGIINNLVCATDQFAESLA